MKILKEKTSGLGGQFSPAYPVNQLIIDLTEYPNGVYILKLINNPEKNFKIIKN